jgi:hypothetical protein
MQFYEHTCNMHERDYNKTQNLLWLTIVRHDSSLTEFRATCRKKLFDTNVMAYGPSCKKNVVMSVRVGFICKSS